MSISRICSCLIPLLLTPLYFGHALACEEFIQHDGAQLSILEEQIQDDSNPLQQLSAFRTLACARDPGIRDFAFRLGLASQNPSMRSSALQLTILNKDTLVVYMLEETEGLTEAQYEYMHENSVQIFNVEFKDFHNHCLSLVHPHSCVSSYRVTINGLAVTIIYDDLRASFTLNDSGKLLGTLTDDRGPTVPAELALF